MMKKNNSNNKTVGQISIDEYIETLTNTTTTDNSQEITTNQKETRIAFLILFCMKDL
ncbi:MAG: hypothetical protein V8R51_00855 [Clostridia bacterium]